MTSSAREDDGAMLVEEDGSQSECMDDHRSHHGRVVAEKSANPDE